MRLGCSFRIQPFHQEVDHIAPVTLLVVIAVIFWAAIVRRSEVEEEIRMQVTAFLRFGDNGSDNLRHCLKDLFDRRCDGRLSIRLRRSRLRGFRKMDSVCAARARFAWFLHEWFS